MWQRHNLKQAEERRERMEGRQEGRRKEGDDAMK